MPPTKQFVPVTYIHVRPNALMCVRTEVLEKVFEAARTLLHIHMVPSNDTKFTKNALSKLTNMFWEIKCFKDENAHKISIWCRRGEPSLTKLLSQLANIEQMTSRGVNSLTLSFDKFMTNTQSEWLCSYLDLTSYLVDVFELTAENDEEARRVRVENDSDFFCKFYFDDKLLLQTVGVQRIKHRAGAFMQYSKTDRTLAKTLTEFTQVAREFRAHALSGAEDYDADEQALKFYAAWNKLYALI